MLTTVPLGVLGGIYMAEYAKQGKVTSFIRSCIEMFASLPSIVVGMFYELCDEINDLDWAVALQQLIELLEDTLKKSNKKMKELIQSQLEQWIAGLPKYIKAYLPISVCES